MKTEREKHEEWLKSDEGKQHMANVEKLCLVLTMTAEALSIKEYMLMFSIGEGGKKIAVCEAKEMDAGFYLSLAETMRAIVKSKLDQELLRMAAGISERPN